MCQHNMGESSGPAYVSVEQPLGVDPPIVHCPICGKATMRILKSGGKVTPCEHLAFIWVGEVGEYEYRSERFEARMAGVDVDEIESDEPLVETLRLAGFDNELLALEITYGGAGCGPMSYTDVFGFDYGTLQAETVGG